MKQEDVGGTSLKLAQPSGLPLSWLIDYRRTEAVYMIDLGQWVNTECTHYAPHGKCSFCKHPEA